MIVSCRLLSRVPNAFFVFARTPRLRNVTSRVSAVRTKRRRQRGGHTRPLSSYPRKYLTTRLSTPHFLHVLSLNGIQLGVQSMTRYSNSNMTRIMTSARAVWTYHGLTQINHRSGRRCRQHCYRVLRRSVGLMGRLFLYSVVVTGRIWGLHFYTMSRHPLIQKGRPSHG